MERHNIYINGKKGQTSEAITWVVATIIIFIMIFIFLFAVLALTKSKGAELSLGSLDFFSVEESGIATQQMLFVLLQAKDEEGESVQSLLSKGRYEEARPIVEQTLNRFREHEISCRFAFRDALRGGTVLQVGTADGGKTVPLMLKEQETSLQC